MPLWVVAAVGAGVAVLVYFGLLLALNRASDPVAVQVAALGRDVEPLVQRRAVVAPQPTTLASLLHDDAAAGRLDVTNHNGAETVVLHDGLFESGSAEVVPSQRPLVESVGRALKQLPGNVLITGHTDDRPIRTLRFPSNWKLSTSRAEAVRAILAPIVGSDRLRAEGRADTEPLVPNDTPAHRSQNRRVEITLEASPTRE